MMSGDKIVGLIAVAMCLVLAIRGFRSREVPVNRAVLMVVIWVIIIAGLTLFFTQIGAS